jgi:hypothetical protein
MAPFYPPETSFMQELVMSATKTPVSGQERKTLSSQLEATDGREVVTSTTDRAKGQVPGALGWLLAGLRHLRHACGHLFSAIAGCLPLVLAAWALTPRYKRQLWTACGVGLLFSVAIYFAGPWLGLLIGWVGGFILALVVQGRDALCRLLTAPASSP